MLDKMGVSQEIKKTSDDNYKEIKPKESSSPDEARSYIDRLFNDGEKDNSKNCDDNGHAYKEGKDLIPNNEYEVNGYRYKTDEEGRIISAEGKLQMKNHEGKPTINTKMEDIGKGYERETDDKGHLIADRFNGSEGLGNLVPQDLSINRGSYRMHEKDLAKEVDCGKDVRVKVEPIYEGGSFRPTDISYTYSIDGKVTQIIFPNGGE
ncbi:MAG: DNA/RNA non-specific endonuclease [Clostridium sp.]